MNTRKKIVLPSQLPALATDLKARGKRIVFTNGCFDLLHPGHVHLLECAKSFGDVLIVGINSDNSVMKLKGSTRPIFNQDDRSRVIASIEAVDYVTVFNQDDPRKVIELIKPHVHVKGGDYASGGVIEEETVRKRGGEVKYVKLLEGYSTTAILNRIKSG